MDKLKELKAEAYDAMVQIEVWKKKLNEINQAISDYKEPENDQPLAGSNNIKKEKWEPRN